ncbi:MAG TPA: hypothetical protein VFG93_00175 [Gaiellaceae bacterium]|nr:hypothetical protein [Gaiellaceae bacterium]
MKRRTIAIAIAVVASSIALVGCADGDDEATNENKTYEPQVAVIPKSVSPKEQAKALRELNDPKIERASVRQLVRESNALLDGIHAIIRRGPTCEPAVLDELEQKIWDLDFNVGSLEGIRLSARNPGVGEMRVAVDGMMADYEASASACRDMGY